jgi:alpha-mannosidase
MQRHADRERKRLKEMVSQLRGQIYSQRMPVENLQVSSPTGRISWDEAQKLNFRQAKPGEQFGPLWTTFWFKGAVTLPADWHGQRIDLIWIAHYCESTLWLEGKAAQALNFSFAERAEAWLVEKAKREQRIDFQIEMACNTSYGEWPPEKPYSALSPYVLDKCEVAVFDSLAWDIYHDFLVLQQLESDIATNQGASNGAFGQHLLYELNRFCNQYDAANKETWQRARKTLLELLSARNGTFIHELAVVGEGHLDIAWYWPLAETWRKIIRTASNQVRLMETYPDYVFVCSQACVYRELKQRLPDLFARVKAKIKSGQWIPVGGTWVEPDCNMPSGESLVRQFLFGQRFFQQEFGFRASEGWFQDAFGFNAQMPQLMKLAGINRFVTQKLLWAHLQPAPRLFTWQGLDGSRILAHVPANNTFSNDLTVNALNKAAAEYPENDRSARSLLSFGWGDGGGGPTPSMVEIISRLKDLQGAPRTVPLSPTRFFDKVEQDLSVRPPLTWVGELYFARHRGTFTSQAAIKKAMRAVEITMHDVEFLCAIAFKLGLGPYPQAEINKLWEIVLLNQFHDILPGTSITEVHQEALQQLMTVKFDADTIKSKILSKLTTSVDSPDTERKPSTTTPVNTIGFSRLEVAEMPDGQIVRIEAPSYGLGRILENDVGGTSVTARENNGRITLENEHLLAEFKSSGELLRLLHKPEGKGSEGSEGSERTEALLGGSEGTQGIELSEAIGRQPTKEPGAQAREALSSTGNRLRIFDDKPLDYDAWELEHYHSETGQDCQPADSHNLEVIPLRAQLTFTFKIGSKSTMTQTVRLDAHSRRLEFHCQVDWNESHKFLKVLFPVSVSADNATYETQFGAVERPTHYNTPYDAARFEVPALKWADLSEHGFGVALLTDCKYGFSVVGNDMQISLLRSPKAPDPQSDMGKHAFAYAIYPHNGTWQEGKVVAEALKFNYPILWSSSTGSPDIASFASTNDLNLVLDTIKKAEDSDAVIVRLYECHGARGTTYLRTALPFKTARFCNLLEDKGNGAKIIDGMVEIPYLPFEVITLLLS